MILLASRLKNDYHEYPIAIDGIIPICVDLLNNPDAIDIHHHVLSVLANISRGAEMDQIIINTERAVQRLVSFLVADNVKMRRDSVMIVLILTTTSLGKAKVQEVNGIEPLVKLLYDADNYVRKCATQAISYLAYDNTTNQSMMRAFGAIKALIKSLIDADFEIRKYAAAAISRRALNVSVEDIEAMNLVEQMSLVSDRYGTTDPSKILMHLVRNEPDKMRQVSNFDMILVVILLSEDDLLVRKKAANWLYCASKEIYKCMRNFLFEAKAIPALVQALSEERNVTIVNTLVKTLNNMSFNDNVSRDNVINAGAIPLLVKLLAECDLEVRTNACNALYWLNYFDQPKIGKKWL
jgi:hypothetical protein